MMRPMRLPRVTGGKMLFRFRRQHETSVSSVLQLVASPDASDMSLRSFR